jgi:hypothetical protein
MPTPLQQVSTSTGGTAAASITLPVSALSAGSTVFVGVCWNTKTKRLSSVSDGTNTYTGIFGLGSSSSGNLNLWVAQGVAAGATSIVAHIDSGTSNGVMMVIEVPGVATSIDNSASTDNTAGGTNHPQTLNPVTLLGTFMLGAMGVGGNPTVSQIGTGFTESTADIGTSGAKLMMAYGTFGAGGSPQTVNWATGTGINDDRGLVSVQVLTPIVLTAPLATGAGTGEVPSGVMTGLAPLGSGAGNAFVPAGIMTALCPRASGQGTAFAASHNGSAPIITRPYWRHPQITPWSEKGGFV